MQFLVLSFDRPSSLIMHAELISALLRLGDAYAIVMQSIMGEKLVQGPYVAARAGFEPAILRTKSPHAPRNSYQYISRHSHNSCH